MILAIIGLVLMVIGVGVGSRQYQKVIGSEVAEGRVESLSPHRGSKGGTTYSVNAVFQDAQGELHRYESGFSSSNPGFDVGDPIRIFFNPQDPSECGVVSFGYRFGFPYIIAIVGLMLLVVPVGWRAGDRWLLAQFPVTVAPMAEGWRESPAGMRAGFSEVGGGYRDGASEGGYAEDPAGVADDGMGQLEQLDTSGITGTGDEVAQPRE
jgi:hypothetical protein